MPYFARDLMLDYGESKFNRLAVSCAQYRHDIRYFEHGCNPGQVIVQCGDGRMVLPTGYMHMNLLAILHDWTDSYQVAIDAASRVICLGDFKHPDFGKRTDTVESYPIDTITLDGIRGDTRDDITLIGGVAAAGASEWLKEYAGNMSGNVLLAPFDASEPQSTAECQKLAKLNFGTASVNYAPNSLNAAILVARYMNSATIYHIGSGTRGFLHAVAVYSGAKLMTVSGKDNFIPETVNHFVTML